MSDVTYIRDEIVVNKDLVDRPQVKGLAPGDTLRLIGRSVRHDPNFVLALPGCNVSVIASHYDANGGQIDISGVAGRQGDAGASGTTGDIGSNGADGLVGGPGGAGVGASRSFLRLICENIQSAHLTATGGAGGDGGTGGSGGTGGRGIRPIPNKTDGVDPGDGGNGGGGGSGGPGGDGGRVDVRYVITGAVTVEIKGGAGGAAGPGGHGGHKGGVGAADGQNGQAGTAGGAGADGSSSISQVTADIYWQAVAAELGPSQTSAWAAYRLRVGEYFYRAEAAPPVGDQGFLALAAQEFDRVVRLTPGDATAMRLSQQILLGQNVLGLPRDLDIVPAFNLYSDAYTQWMGLVFGAFNTGITTLLAATTLDDVKKILEQNARSLDDAVAIATADHAVAVVAQNTATTEAKAAQAHLDDITRQIIAAQAEMNNHSVSIGAIFGAVAEVAGAVVAVIAAIPTGGASLVALVPAVIALTKTVYETAPLVVQELLKGDPIDTKNVSEAYKKVNKDVGDVIAAGKAIINLVTVIEKLDAGKTADNSKYMELVKQGVEAGHAQLLASLRRQQADLGVLAIQVRIDRATAAKAVTDDMLRSTVFDQSATLKTGLAMIEAASVDRDSLLTYAFYAQRAVEIYTLQTESGVVRMDSGYIHPDVQADFLDQYLPATQLTQAYAASWDQFLTPIQLQTDYLAYFSNPGRQLNFDARRLTFDDPMTINAFIGSTSLDFAVSTADLPAAHYDAKIQGVAVSFVGATSPSGVTTCAVRHELRYEQKRPDGTMNTQLLRPHSSTIQCPHTELQLDGVNVVPGDPVTEPQALSLWGRGVAGEWNVSISNDEIKQQGLDLTTLTKVQVWITYQYLTA